MCPPPPSPHPPVPPSFASYPKLALAAAADRHPHRRPSPCNPPPPQKYYTLAFCCCCARAHYYCEPSLSLSLSKQKLHHSPLRTASSSIPLPLPIPPIPLPSLAADYCRRPAGPERRSAWGPEARGARCAAKTRGAARPTAPSLPLHAGRSPLAGAALTPFINGRHLSPRHRIALLQFHRPPPPSCHPPPFPQLPHPFSRPAVSLPLPLVYTANTASRRRRFQLQRVTSKIKPAPARRPPACGAQRDISQSPVCGCPSLFSPSQRT